MKPEDMLPPELVWQDDGHVSEVALGALADGEEELVPVQAARHAAACDACSARLGEQALLSLSTSEALALMEPATQRRPVPVLAISLALALAALGAAPALIDLVGGLGSLPEATLRGLLLSTRAVAALVRAAAGAEAGTWAVAWTAAALILMALGTLVARAASARKETA